jgi:hypothetical protein
MFGKTNLKQAYIMKNIYSFVFFLDSLEASFWSCFRFILGRCSTKSFQLFAKILFYHDITKII